MYHRTSVEAVCARIRTHTAESAAREICGIKESET
jgi:hypothetical protein